MFTGAKPQKQDFTWHNGTTRYMWLDKAINVLFPMIKWEDTEPWMIDDLKKLEVEP